MSTVILNDSIFFYLSFPCVLYFLSSLLLFIFLFFHYFIFLFISFSFLYCFLLYFSLLIYFMSLYVSSSLLVFFFYLRALFFSFTFILLFLYLCFSCSSLSTCCFLFLFFPFLKLRTSFLDQNSFHNSYLVNLVCVVLIIIHILYTTLAEHWSKTRLLPRDIRLGCRPDLSSKVGEKRSTATCSFTEKLAAHPGSLPMSNLYIQWDLTWGVQGLWRHIAAKGPHSVQERKSSESWLETRKDKKEWKKLGKKAHNCINTCLTASLFRLLPAVPMRPSKTSHLGWCEVSIDGWKSLSKLLKESMKSKIQKDHEKVLLAAIWPVQA